MKTLLTLALVAFGFLVIASVEQFAASGQLRPWFFENTSGGAAVAGRSILLAVLLILGTVAGELHQVLTLVPPGRRVNPTSVLKRAFQQGSLWRSLIASPLAFGVVYMLTREQPDLVIAGVLSFENGFFCQAVLRKRAQQMGEGVDHVPTGSSTKGALKDEQSKE